MLVITKRGEEKVLISSVSRSARRDVKGVVWLCSVYYQLLILRHNVTMLLSEHKRWSTHPMKHAFVESLDRDLFFIIMGLHSSKDIDDVSNLFPPPTPSRLQTLCPPKRRFVFWGANFHSTSTPFYSSSPQPRIPLDTIYRIRKSPSSASRAPSAALSESPQLFFHIGAWASGAASAPNCPSLKPASVRGWGRGWGMGDGGWGMGGGCKGHI